MIKIKKIKKEILLLFILVIYSNLFGQTGSEYKKLISEGKNFYDEKKYKSSLAKYEEAFLIKKDVARDLYNGACSAALAKKKRKALSLLMSAVENGYSNADHLQKDKDLYILHSIDEYESIVTKVKGNDRQDSPDVIVDSIRIYVRKNKWEKVYDLCSEEYKKNMNRNEFNNTLYGIDLTMLINDLSSFKDFRKSSSSSTTLLNNEMTQTATYNYRYTPLFFGEMTEALFVKAIGYTLHIELIKAKTNWKIKKITSDRNRLSSDYTMKDYIKTFFRDSVKYNLKFTTLLKQKTIVGTAVEDLVNIELKFEDINLEYIAHEDFNKKDTGDIYSLSFYKKRTDSSTKKPSDIKSYFNTPSYDYLEFIFFDNKSNLALISNGEKYGFYKINKKENLKDVIKNKLLKLN